MGKLESGEGAGNLGMPNTGERLGDCQMLNADSYLFINQIFDHILDTNSTPMTSEEILFLIYQEIKSLSLRSFMTNLVALLSQSPKDLTSRWDFTWFRVDTRLGGDPTP